MKLYAVQLICKPDSGAKPFIIKGAYDLNSFGFFQRQSVQEFMVFTGQVIVERVAPGSRVSVKEQEYICHAYAISDGLAGVCITDAEYSRRVAHTLLAKLLDDFQATVPKNVWVSPPSTPGAENESVAKRFPQLEKYITDYQNPQQVDALTKLQMDLDETKIILHNTLETLLQRDEKLSDLVAKSESLSAQSKMFYKTAAKTNRCCNIL